LFPLDNASVLGFKHAGKQLFEIPLSDVAQATLASKNDVAIEFHQDDITAGLEHDFLSEIRFYIPPDKTDKKDKEGEGEKNGEPEQSAAERFQKRVLAKADVISYAGSGIVVFKDLTLVFPRCEIVAVVIVFLTPLLQRQVRGGVLWNVPASARQVVRLQGPL
jgi:hypothetical protein